VCALALVLGHASDVVAVEGPRFSTAEELKRDVDAAPCNGTARLDAVIALFKGMGATDAEICVDYTGRSRNVVVRKPGGSDEVVVVGAHYDKTAEGCGAVDNWTGIVSLAHAYRTLRTVQLNKTVLFVAFDQEERGLAGSYEMVNAIPKRDLQKYCAMINFDSFGMGRPQAAPNLSSPKLTKCVEETAKVLKIPFSSFPIDGARADSLSFKARGIPAVTMHGLTNEWQRVLHSPKDVAQRVDSNELYLSYRLALVVIAKVSEEPCGAFR
jgi:Iap family predicted aminopeptidase